MLLNFQDLDQKYKKIGGNSKVNSFTEKKHVPFSEDETINKEKPLFKPTIRD
jgi:hypothetical protein